MENTIYKKTQLGLVPSEWEEILFGDIFEEVSETTNDTDRYPLYSLTIEDGVTPKSERYERSFLITKETDSYKVVKKDEFVYNPMNLRFGALARLKEDKEVAVSGYYNVFKVKPGYSPEFMDYFLKSDRMMYLYNAHATGSLKEKQRVHYSQFIKFELPIPSIAEANKITSVLLTCDKAIKLKEKLIQQKIMQKKGLMQEVLTGNSRLKGFERNWKQLKIKDFCKTYSGGTPSRSKKEYYLDGTIPWIKSGELNSGKVTDVEEYITELGLKNSSAKLVYPDTILLALYGATAGVIAKCEITGTINQAILAIIPNEECNNDYLFYLLGHQMSQIVNTYTQGGQPNLNADMIKKLIVKLPSLDEQNEIAQIFKTYDKEIELNKEELKFLKLQKQTLMQQLLTGKIRVKV